MTMLENCIETYTHNEKLIAKMVNVLEGKRRGEKIKSVSKFRYRRNIFCLKQNVFFPICYRSTYFLIVIIALVFVH